MEFNITDRLRPLSFGDRVGRLTVIARYDSDWRGQARYVCVCDCNKLTIVYAYNLRNGHTRSCGCLAREIRRQQQLRHGCTETPTYAIWTQMHTRCYNPNATGYRYYGARGVKICDRWHRSNLSGFENFLADMGERPAGLTIDRINPYGDYEPANCRWATWKQQGEHRRRRVMLALG